ncbi:trypsin-like [Petaurus breviceps papuanus]|uniref:trypsin-like n=1 Tax=Petaurus breviceps papuanus TaxID=3040969 RepID=UPI0036DAE8AC
MALDAVADLGIFKLKSLTADQTLASLERNYDDTTIPYMAYLKSSSPLCMGTLIFSQWVITAAHCNIPSEIRLGVLQPNVKEKRQQTRICSVSIKHPDFSPQNLDNNLMLIKLNKPANLNKHVGTVALAIAPSETKRCFIPGWIWTQLNNSSDPDILSWVTHDILPDDECAKMLPGKMSANKMCVGFYDDFISPCQEISAVPAICDGRIHGILTMSYGCVLQGSGGLFTKVHKYREWIQNVTSSF